MTDIHRDEAERRLSPVLLLVLVFSAAAIVLWEPVSLPQLLEWGAWLANQPWAIAVLILIQVVMFALALPGTMIIWLVAPFHPPVMSVAIMLAGSLGGAIAAYRIGRGLGAEWRPRRGAWLVTLLTRRSDFFTQCGLRVLPGCPHWIVNYGAGILRLPQSGFLLAATTGLTIKWSLYSWVIHGTTNAAQADENIGLASLWPLLLLAGLLIVGSYLRQRIHNRHYPEHAQHPGE